MEIFYKPRSMDNEKIYNELLQWISKRTNITQYSYPFLSKKNYSWSSAIYYKECGSMSRFINYFFIVHFLSNFVANEGQNTVDEGQCLGFRR